MKDLVVLVADRDMEASVRGLLSRPHSIDIREITFDVFSHVEHDPGCAVRGVAFLSPFRLKYGHALLMFDHEGSGKSAMSVADLQDSIDREFAGSQWSGRAKTIVLAPELEAWVWSDSPHVDRVLGWQGRKPSLRDWLFEQGWVAAPTAKPQRPKAAFDAALRAVNRARSASLFRRLASEVSLRRCTDPAFTELKRILKLWFPREMSGGYR